MLSVQDLIRLYDLKPLPEEGGYYKELYRSTQTIPAQALAKAYAGDRSTVTHIYYLLGPGMQSNFHKLLSDEFWHLYLGGPLMLEKISPEGKAETLILGQNIQKGQHVQALLPAGCWFGAYPGPGCQYALLGCTVVPGFEFQDFELGKRADMLRKFPQHRAIIERLTP